jgi:hypothetical protein
MKMSDARSSPRSICLADVTLRYQWIARAIAVANMSMIALNLTG